MCVSKARLSQICTSVANAAIETFERDAVVAHLFLEKNLLCTSRLDNLDVNPKSATATGSLHGTAASINEEKTA